MAVCPTVPRMCLASAAFGRNRPPDAPFTGPRPPSKPFFQSQGPEPRYEPASASRTSQHPIITSQPRAPRFTSIRTPTWRLPPLHPRPGLVHTHLQASYTYLSLGLRSHGEDAALQGVGPFPTGVGEEKPKRVLKTQNPRDGLVLFPAAQAPRKPPSSEEEPEAGPFGSMSPGFCPCACPPSSATSRDSLPGRGLGDPLTHLRWLAGPLGWTQAPLEHD